MNSTPQILDPCCGGKMLWFNKNDRRAVFCDRRREKHILCDGRVFEVNPDTVCDFRKLPFPDESFFLRLCHNKQLINSHFYRGVSELPYKLLFAVIYTHLEF